MELQQKKRFMEELPFFMKATFVLVMKGFINAETKMKMGGNIKKIASQEMLLSWY